MEGKKWYPCFCTMILGAAVIVFTWWAFSWSRILLTIIGALVILKGLINKCCCYGDKSETCCK